MSQWGAGTSNESKPKETWITNNTIGSGNNSANTYATERGWVFRWPWGEEVLAAIGGLSTLLAAPTYTGVQILTGNGSSQVSNAASQNVAVLLTWNEALTVNGTPTIVMIGANGAANVTLTYNAGLSAPERGVLAFRNNNVNLSAITPGGTLTVNATSGTSNFANYDKILDAVNTAVNVSSSLAGFSAAITIDEYEPLVNDVDAMVEAPTADEDQSLEITIGYNTAVSVTGTPTILAIASGANAIANQTLTYNAAASNTAGGRLVFGIYELDLTDEEGTVFTVNATSTLVGFTSVTSAASGNAAPNTINGIANTITVAASA